MRHYPVFAQPVSVWNPEIDDRLVCVAAFAETHDVKTFVFAAPEPRRFVFEPGQFLTFSFEIGGQTINRCYSLASSPLRPYYVSITVKRTPGGLVSGWLHDNMRAGAIVRAIGPMGDFTAFRHPATKYLFLSGGSGITPLMSMSRAFADMAGPVDIVFLHAARSPMDLVFRAELDLVARRLPGFRLVYLPEHSAGEPGWPGLIGRISGDVLRCVAPDIAERAVFCCGPDPFMRAAHALCAELGAPAKNYHQESFNFATLVAEESPATVGIAPAKINGETSPGFSVTFVKMDRKIEVQAGQSILAAAREAGLRLPSSCATGLCGTCKSKLVSGKVDMKHQGGIRQREIDAGFFLPCCSRPLSDLTVDR